MPINLYTAQSLKPCVLVGVGAQKYGQHIGAYTAHIYKRILSSEFMHSVRDSFTEEQIRSVGINNVINTGCPTMWGLTSKKCSKVPSRKGKDVIFTLTDYKPDRKRDQYLIDVLRKEYEDIYFWVQGSRDYEYLKTLDNIESIKIVSPSLQGYDSFLENTKNIDYVGTRLHGGMRALQHEKRTIILGIDNRAIELNKDYNIPVIEQKNLSDLHNLINDTWGTEIKLPTEAIKKFLGQFGITYVSE